MIWIHNKLVCNKIKLGYEWVWHLQVQTVSSSKGETPVPPPPFPDWGHSLASLSRGRVLSWSSPGAGPSVKFGEAGSPAQEKAFSKMKRSRRQISVRKRAGTFRIAVLRVWSVEPLMSLRPFPEIPEVKTTFTASLRYYLTSHYVDICFDVSLSSNRPW